MRRSCRTGPCQVPSKRHGGLGGMIGRIMVGNRSDKRGRRRGGGAAGLQASLVGGLPARPSQERRGGDRYTHQRNDRTESAGLASPGIILVVDEKPAATLSRPVVLDVPGAVERVADLRHVNQSFAHDDTGNAHAPIDPRIRDAVKVEAYTTASIAPQRKTAFFPDQHSGLFDTAADRSHGGL